MHNSLGKILDHFFFVILFANISSDFSKIFDPDCETSLLVSIAYDAMFLVQTFIDYGDVDSFPHSPVLQTQTYKSVSAAHSYL